jgi:hypothetical protein
LSRLAGRDPEHPIVIDDDVSGVGVALAWLMFFSTSTIHFIPECYHVC